MHGAGMHGPAAETARSLSTGPLGVVQFTSPRRLPVCWSRAASIFQERASEEITRAAPAAGRACPAGLAPSARLQVAGRVGFAGDLTLPKAAEAGRTILLYAVGAVDAAAVGVRGPILRAAKGLTEVACHGPGRAMANREGDAAEVCAKVAAADMIAQADTAAIGAAGIALSGQAGQAGIAIADAFSVRSADAAAVAAGEITRASAAVVVAGALWWLDALPALAMCPCTTWRVRAPATVRVVVLDVDAEVVATGLAGGTGTRTGVSADSAYAFLATAAAGATRPTVLDIGAGIHADLATLDLAVLALLLLLFGADRNVPLRLPGVGVAPSTLR